jgi:hypothetical protein
MTQLYYYLLVGLFIATVGLVKLSRDHKAGLIMADSRRQYGKIAFVIGMTAAFIFILVAWPYFIIKEL